MTGAPTVQCTEMIIISMRTEKEFADAQRVGSTMTRRTAMELIDREALIEKIEKRIPHMIPNILGTHDVTAEGIVEFIKSQPTIESRPKGEWKQRTDFDEDNNAIFECSNCLHGDVQAKGSEVPFCWYCGADMQMMLSRCKVKGVQNGRI